MLKHFINDPHFEVVLDKNGSSPSPEAAIWTGQHQCVCEGFAPEDKIPSSPGDAIIRHQLKVEHWGVLNKAFICLHVKGFPHSTVMQIVRHQDSSYLVQSGRYTGDRFLKVASGELDVEEVFYLRPVGAYTNRKADSQGNKYEYTERQRELDIIHCRLSAIEYQKRIEQGFSEEHARDIVVQCFRQNFNISGTLEAIFHLLDQRTKADSQFEAQTLAELIMQRVEEWSPTLGAWYRRERYGKARLAP